MISVRFEKVPETEPITVNHYEAQVEELANAKTHKYKFTAAGGGHVTTYDMFKTMDMYSKEKEIKYMEDDKKSCKKLTEVKEKATEVLDGMGSDFDQLRATELTDLLR